MQKCEIPKRMRSGTPVAHFQHQTTPNFTSSCLKLILLHVRSLQISIVICFLNNSTVSTTVSIQCIHSATYFCIIYVCNFDENFGNNCLFRIHFKNKFTVHRTIVCIETQYAVVLIVNRCIKDKKENYKYFFFIYAETLPRIVIDDLSDLKNMWSMNSNVPEIIISGFGAVSLVLLVSRGLSRIYHYDIFDSCPYVPATNAKCYYCCFVWIRRCTAIRKRSRRCVVRFVRFREFWFVFSARSSLRFCCLSNIHTQRKIELTNVRVDWNLKNKKFKLE